MGFDGLFGSFTDCPKSGAIMDKEKFDKAQSILRKIGRTEDHLARLDQFYENVYALPEDIFKRHLEEVRVVLQSRLVELDKEFEAL